MSDLGAPPRETHLDTSEGLREALRGRAPLFAVLDAARDPEILPMLRGSGEPFASLYSGARGRRLADVAPHVALVSTETTTGVGGGSSILDAVVRRGWGESWGMFVEAKVPLDVLRRHLRRFLTVETEDGEALTFRFYDPRVTRPFLSSSTPTERADFFGPITTLFVEAAIAGPSTPALLAFDRIGPEVPPLAAPHRLPLIRDAQLAAFTDALEQDFSRRVARRLERSLDVGVEAAPAWARNILAREDLEPAQKLARIERRLRQTSR